MSVPAISPIIAPRPEQPMQAPPAQPGAYAKPLKFRWFDILLEDRTLSDTKLRLAMMLYSYADNDGHNIRPGRETLAARLGVTMRTMHRLLPQLEQEQWIACVAKGNNLGQKGSSSHYILRIPDRHFGLGAV